MAMAPSNANCSCPNCGVSIATEPGQLDGITISGTSVSVRTLKADQPLLFRLLTKVQVCCPSVKDKMCNWKGNYGQLHMHKGFVHKGVATSQYLGVSKGSGMTKPSNDFKRRVSFDGILHNKPTVIVGTKLNRASSDVVEHRSQIDMTTKRMEAENSPALYGLNGTTRTGLSAGSDSDYTTKRGSGVRITKLNDVETTGFQRSRSFRRGHTKEANANLLSMNESRTRMRSMSPTGPTIRNDPLSNSLSNNRSQSISPTRQSSRKLESGKPNAFERNVPSRAPQHSHFDVVKINTPRSEAQQIPKEEHVQRPQILSRSLPKPKFLDPLTVLKDNANDAFKTGNFTHSKRFSHDAILLYEQQKMSKGENAELAATLYANRAAANLRLGEYQACIQDANHAIQANPGYPKAYLRKAWAQSELGMYEDAIRTLANGTKRNPSALELSSELTVTKKTLAHVKKIEGLIESNELGAAYDSLQVIKKSPRNTRVWLAFILTDLGLGNADSVIEAANNMLVNDSTNCTAMAARGEAYFYNGNFIDAVRDLRNASQYGLDSDTIQTKLNQYRRVQQHLLEATSALNAKAYTKVIELCTLALLESAPLPTPSQLYRILHAQRGEAHLGNQDYDAALSDAMLSLSSKADWLPAISIKVQVYRAQERYEDIVDEFDEILKTWGKDNEYIKQVVAEAQSKLVHHGDRINFYALFRVDKNASVDEIRKSYKKLVRECHPDRLAGTKHSTEEREAAEIRFKLLGEGFELLSSTLGRELYDQGIQVGQIHMQLYAAERRQATAAAY